MSRHNIVGSEAFERTPSIYVRHMRPGGFRRRRSRMVLAFLAGAVVALGAGAAAIVVAFGPGITG